jgi:hypothetical protein
VLDTVDLVTPDERTDIAEVSYGRSRSSWYTGNSRLIHRRCKIPICHIDLIRRRIAELLRSSPQLTLRQNLLCDLLASPVGTMVVPCNVDPMRTMEHKEMANPVETPTCNGCRLFSGSFEKSPEQIRRKGSECCKP